MSIANVNGIQIFYELTGSGETPIVFVHGAWSSHNTWDAIVPLLASHFASLPMPGAAIVKASAHRVRAVSGRMSPIWPP